MKDLSFKIICINCLIVFSLIPIKVNSTQSDFITYKPEDVSLQLGIKIINNNYFEKNVTITDQNKSLTLVANVNSGTIWAVFIEPRHNYYYEKSRIPDPTAFCGVHSLLGEQKLANVDYYGVGQVTREVGEYTLAVFNLQDTGNLDLNLVILNKIIGNEVIIKKPDSIGSIDWVKTISFLVVIVVVVIFTYKIIDKLDKRYFLK